MKLEEEIMESNIEMHNNAICITLDGFSGSCPQESWRLFKCLEETSKRAKACMLVDLCEIWCSRQ